MTLQSDLAQWSRTAALAALFWTGALAGAVSPIPATTPAPPSGRWRDVTLDDYRNHLSELETLVHVCANARDLKNCDPLLVGPDDRVPLGNGNAGRRLVRYGWLRVLFSKAEESDAPPASSDGPVKGTSGSADAPASPPPTSTLLQKAEQRLAVDLAQAGAAGPAAPAHLLERETMAQVLAGRDFRGLEQPSVRDSIEEKVGNWLNHLLESATRLRARSAWIGRLLVWGFILAVCVALVWALLQLERKWRVRLVPDDRSVPSPNAPSARNWQLWLEDARRAAAAGMWRDAIHLVYWAAIARLESRRLWPADRARTPREYLALIAPDDPRRAGLAALTGSFERTWYGGRNAVESDYRQAEAIASSLIEGGAA